MNELLQVGAGTLERIAFACIWEVFFPAWKGSRRLERMYHRFGLMGPIALVAAIFIGGYWVISLLDVVVRALGVSPSTIWAIVGWFGPGSIAARKLFPDDDDDDPPPRKRASLRERLAALGWTPRPQGNAS